MNKNPYKEFPNYVLRTPLFSVSFFKKITSDLSINDDTFYSLIKNPFIRESIFLSSPILYQEMAKWPIEEVKKKDKLKISVLKYISRMSTRCTPFGLFAGCSVGELANETRIELDDKENNSRFSRLDMNYLVKLSSNLSKVKEIKKQLLFFPNTSIYKIADKFRYIEYEYLKNKRMHSIVAVNCNEYLNKVIKISQKGVKLDYLVKELIDDEITQNEATDFIEELISNQILVSELEPSVSGSGFLNQIISVCEKLKDIKPITNKLKLVKKKLQLLDKSAINPISSYYELAEKINELGTSFDIKYLFQIDMMPKHIENTINKRLISDIKNGFTFLNKISISTKTTSLKKFKDLFYKRYGDKEIALSSALDVELGIGYVQNKYSGDVNPLIDDLVILTSNSSNSFRDIKWSPIYSILNRHITKALRENKYIVKIKDEYFENFEANWNDFPDTVSSIVELITENNTQKIKLDAFSGSSSSNLLGRFCNSDKNIHDHVNSMIQVENHLNKGQIIAEIVHLPESRTGNILYRPNLRKYEIPYLAKSTKKNDCQIPINDLMISVRNGKIYLRSKKFNKEVLPRLTNAHNYAYNSLPIYHFLADMQTEGKRSGVRFNIGPLANNYEFIPRIEYKNIILMNATWNLNKDDIQDLIKSQDNDVELLLAVKKVRDLKKLPPLVTLDESDNRLLINFENLTLVRMFINHVKKSNFFKLREFLFSEGVVKSKEKQFANEIVVSFFNSKKLK